MSKRSSFNRWAVDIMMTSRTGRPFLDLIKVCGALGSNQVETACVMRITVEELQRIVDGRQVINTRQADWLSAYQRLLWWWHCWREDKIEAEDPDLLEELCRSAMEIWGELPERLRSDWAEAYRTVKTEATR